MGFDPGAAPLPLQVAHGSLISVPVPPLRLEGATVRGLRVGVPREYFIQGIQPEVELAVRDAIQTLASLGAQIVEISLPHTEYALPVYYLIAPAEASANLARFDGVRYGLRVDGSAARAGSSPLWELYEATRGQGFGAEVKRRIMLGTYVLSAGYYDAYYLKAQQVRTLILRDYEQAFGGETAVDVIAMPTSPTAAFRLGERVSDPLQMYLADIFTVSANLAGLPAISVPCGFTSDRLPIGLQLTGRRFDEATVLRIADAYERDTQWRNQRPSIASH